MPMGICLKPRSQKSRQQLHGSGAPVKGLLSPLSMQTAQWLPHDWRTRPWNADALKQQVLSHGNLSPQLEINIVIGDINQHRRDMCEGFATDSRPAGMQSMIHAIDSMPACQIRFSSKLAGE